MTDTPTPPPAPQQQNISIPLPVVKPYVTYGLLVVLAVVYLAQLYTNQMSNFRAEPILTGGAIDFQSILAGQYYRLLTSMFVHVSNAHILFNGLALYSIGIIVERFYGHSRFTLIYFLSGLLGSVAVFMFSRDATAGASGAIFGVFGAQTVFFWRNRKILGEAGTRALRASAVTIAINLGITLYSQLDPNVVQISLWGHVGGLAGGVILGWYLTPLYQVVRDAPSTFGLKVVDLQPLDKRWVVPTIFAVVLVAMFVVTLLTFRRSMVGY